MNNQPELEVDVYGCKQWVLNGLYHREDGPAVEYKNGDKAWYLNGIYHREDGPAIIHPNGEKEWWFNDYKMSKAEWFRALTPEQQYDYLWSLDE
jgi:hypothetical protein